MLDALLAHALQVRKSTPGSLIHRSDPACNTPRSPIVKIDELRHTISMSRQDNPFNNSKAESSLGALRPRCP
jgi:hypothetical protein